MARPQMHALRLIVNGSDTKPTLSLTTTPEPTPPAGFVLVKIKAAGINPSDILNAKGGFPSTTYPRVPGRDYAGVVEDGPTELIGKEVFGSGDAATSFTVDGTHAEYCILPTRVIILKPTSLSFEQAATIGIPFTTAALLLRRTMVKLTDVVLVLGSSGAVGSAACQLAKAQGCKVLTATRRDGSDVNLATDPEMKVLANKAPDVVIDTIGSPALLNAALSRMAPRGRLGYIAAPREGSTDWSFDMKALYRDEKMIIGCNSLLMTAEEMARDFEIIRAGLDDGRIEAPKSEDLDQIGRERAVEAYELMMAGKSRGKKVIVF